MLWTLGEIGLKALDTNPKILNTNMALALGFLVFNLLFRQGEKGLGGGGYGLCEIGEVHLL